MVVSREDKIDTEEGAERHLRQYLPGLENGIKNSKVSPASGNDEAAAAAMAGKQVSSTRAGKGQGGRESLLGAVGQDV